MTLEIVTTIILLILALVLDQVLQVIIPPRNFPRNIPTIPFYVSFLGQFTNLDQKDIYEYYLKDKLESYGAVKIFFASRWNILVTKPEYLQQIFRQDDVFAKSGNQKKIPHSVLAEYTGNNVISADGEEWRKYRNLLTNPIMFADLQPLENNCKRLINLIEERMVNGCATIAVSDILQRFCISNVGACVLGADFKTLQSDDVNSLHRQLRYVKSQIFKPLFMSFPSLDRFPFPSRMKARNVIRKFKTSYKQLLQSESTNQNRERAGPVLCQALEQGCLTTKEFEDNAMILLIAGHENPQLLMSSLLFVLASYPSSQDQIREEMQYGKEPEYLTSFIYETIRLYPPLGQIINRCTTTPTFLGGNIKIPKGVYVGYNNFATQRSRSVWGDDASEFKPNRWGNGLEQIQRNYNAAKSKSTLPAFHGRRRACIGEKFALNVAKAFVIHIVSNFQITTAPNWQARLTPSGPVSPLGLCIKFEKIKQSELQR